MDDEDNYGYDTADPTEAYRVTWTHFMLTFIRVMSDGGDSELPIMVRTGRVILASSCAGDEAYRTAMRTHATDKDLMAHCQAVADGSASLSYEAVMRRELEWREMEELQQVAVRHNLWGRYRVRPDPDSLDYLAGDDSE